MGKSTRQKLKAELRRSFFINKKQQTLRYGIIQIRRNIPRTPFSFFAAYFAICKFQFQNINRSIKIDKLFTILF